MRQPVILVTGFGAFPGAPQNPTGMLMRRLAALEGRLARLGVRLERRTLPVVFDEIAPRLEGLVADIEPDIILHFGFARRRKAISIEQRALNCLNLLHPDASGRCAASRAVTGDGEFVRKGGLPASRLDQALRQAGIASELSIDAGDYVCNQTFYLSLAMARGTDRKVGFIHVPKLDPASLLRAAGLIILAAVPELRAPGRSQSYS